MSNNGPDDAASILAHLPEIVKRVDRTQLILYIEDLLEWNPRIGLVSKRDSGGTLVRLITRSAQLWDILVERAPEVALRENLSVVDIGSGGGFPGIIWYLLNSEISAVLVERKEKKAFFLERCARRLNEKRLSVERRDVRELAREKRHAEAYDIAVAMAVAAPKEFGEAVRPLLKPGGLLITPRGGTEHVHPPAIGSSLVIHAAVESGEGPVLIYQKRHSN